MRISVITVSFNSSATIADTLISISNQSYKNIEHIIIDGASTDNTLEIVRNFPHVNRIVCEPDNGLYDAMNKGIGLSSGDVIGILNSDDVYASDVILQQVADCFAKNPGVMAIYGDISYFVTGNMNKVVRYYKTKPFYPRFFEHGNMPPHPSLFVRKEVYDKLGKYKTHYKISADQEFIIRMLKVHSVPSLYVDTPMVKMRLGGRSTRGLKSYLFNTTETIKTWHDNGLKYPVQLLFIRPVRKIAQLIIRK